LPPTDGVGDIPANKELAKSAGFNRKEFASPASAVAKFKERKYEK
jgi:hypothetical protein